jgi:hypothetical protein
MLGCLDAYRQIVVPEILNAHAQVNGRELCIIEKQIISIYIVATHASDFIYTELPENAANQGCWSTASVCRALRSNN